VDEYALLQVFSKFGKIAKLDFLFHKSGAYKGKPRGYAFVEFMNEADAAKALQTANGKLFRGRKLVVTFAQQAPSYDSGSTSYASRSKRSDATPTALSLVKSGGIARPEAKTCSKIAIMEAKLRQMANSSPFTERPGLPSKPAVPRRGGTQSRRAMGHGTGAISGNTERTKKDGHVTHGRPTTLPSMHDAESSDMTRIPPSTKQRSIPGVKILKGKGYQEVTPST
jgi:RNA recognition motif-containing protein